MKFYESHFWYNQRQRKGILVMAVLLSCMQVFLYFSDEVFSGPGEVLDQGKLKKWNARLDSLMELNKESVERPVYSINPNYLTDFRGFMLGMSTEEIDRLLSFREKGEFLHSAREFQEVTGVSDSLMSAIAHRFRFPSFERKNPDHRPGLSTAKTTVAKRDLNRASTQELSEVHGVGPTLSKRIVSYRDYLGGYSFDGQLFEVYNLPEETGKKILERFEIRERPLIEKVNLNQASFREILALPYIDYRLTQRIMDFRNREKVITDLSELKKIDSFPLDKFDRIALYLLAE